MNQIATDQVVVHVSFDGQSEDISLETLFNPIPEALTQEFEHNPNGIAAAGSAFVSTIKEALANHYDRPVNEFADYAVDFSENRNITVRPKAEFGTK